MTPTDELIAAPVGEWETTAEERSEIAHYADLVSGVFPGEARPNSLPGRILALLRDLDRALALLSAERAARKEADRIGAMKAEQYAAERIDHDELKNRLVSTEAALAAAEVRIKEEHRWVRTLTSKNIVEEDLAAERDQNKRLVEALATADSWLMLHATHVGKCIGKTLCTCGLEAVRAETGSVLAALAQPEEQDDRSH